MSLEVLMSREELDVLIDELRRLEQAAVGSASGMEDLYRIGTAALAGETAFLARDRGDQTFSDFLRKREGLPPPPPDSPFRRTQEDLLQADDATRGALDSRLRTALARLIARRNSTDWVRASRTVQGLAGVPYDAIP